MYLHKVKREADVSNSECGDRVQVDNSIAFTFLFLTNTTLLTLFKAYTIQYKVSAYYYIIRRAILSNVNP